MPQAPELNEDRAITTAKQASLVLLLGCFAQGAVSVLLAVSESGSASHHVMLWSCNDMIMLTACIMMQAVNFACKARANGFVVNLCCL